MSAAPTPKSSGSFSDLIQQEYEQLKLREKPGQSQPPVGTSPPWIDPDEFDVAQSDLTQEPWVRFTKRDLFGLAFSGGGIRSATFNLGILQALERLGVLRHVNYLSTVSGGGYVGSFWTAWLRRGKDLKSSSFFPSASPADPRSNDEREKPEIRHLREFSRFLMPRVGFWHFETWGAIVAILGGMIPAMVAALSTLAAILYGWFLLSALALKWEQWCSTILFGVITLTFHLSAEWAWRRNGKNGNSEKNFWRNVPLTAMTAVIAAVAWFFIRKYQFPELNAGHWVWPVRYWEIVSEKNFFRDPAFHLTLLLPSAAWFAAGFSMLGLRGFVARAAPDEKAVTWSGGVDRSAARCFTCAVISAGLALLWTGCHELLDWIGHTAVFGRETSGGVAAGGTAAGGAFFGAIFFWLRDWLTKPSEETRATNLWEKYAEKIKPLMPQLAAIGAMFCMVLTCVLLIQSYGSGQHLWAGLLVSVFFILLTLFCFDPARIGMHDFYRSRLARCYLGAAPGLNKKPTRATAEQTDDDIRFGDLRGETVPPGPIHLVCCAANNLAGDPLSSLYRGARSVAISPVGLSLGNEYAAVPHLRLSSAVTASAAAFNSQMGRISMDLGFAVAFVMSALNLRLGLWVSHPGNPTSRIRWMVGLPFFFEMFGRSKCPSLDQPVVNTPPPFENNAGAGNVASPATDTLLNRCASNVSHTFKAAEAAVKKKISYLHLSDGNHFENLGLYELVRRHCRYVIVSDCGADPEVAFDDLANTLRRIREDFGVEIELDVEPLRPAENGRSRQHAVVGCIHYDGMAGTDKGTVIYFKPTLTGDEPADVLQYRTRNIAFPHEGTGDQFYDEAQWESYRRLGEHAAISVLRFEVENTKPSSFVDNMFLEVGNQWHPNKAQHQEIFLELTARCGDLENEIRASASNQLLAELFPEAASASAAKPAAGKKAPAEKEATTDSEPRDENIQTLFYLMRVVQIMEDAWVGAELNEYWSHPLNAGWMSYFQRWASTPSFRHWWPVLRSIYSAGFRNFVKERFDLRLPRGEYDKPAARLDLKPLGALETLPTSHAWHQWTLRYGAPHLTNKKALAFALTLEASGTIQSGAPIDVGFLLYQETPGHEGARCAAWDCREMFVPHALNGAGISARFLESTIDYFRDQQPHLTGLRVDIDYEEESTAKKAARPNRASRLERVQTIGFYKSRGFTYLSGEESTILCFDLERARTEQAARHAHPQKSARHLKHA